LGIRNPCKTYIRHYVLPATFVFLHAAMRVNDPVKVEGPANLDLPRARRDLLDEFFRIAGICRETDGSRDRLHGREVVERPFLPTMPVMQIIPESGG
jgi:hypothetical protein